MPVIKLKGFNLDNGLWLTSDLAEMPNGTVAVEIWQTTTKAQEYSAALRTIANITGIPEAIVEKRIDFTCVADHWNNRIGWFWIPKKDVIVD